MSRWPAGDPPAVGPIRVNVTHVFVSVAVDLDNLAKPVLDALKGVVFQDDGQISDIRMRKREFGRILRIETSLPLLWMPWIYVVSSCTSSSRRHPTRRS
jgi:crossover junction endodeoxyribonuclease RusA